MSTTSIPRSRQRASIAVFVTALVLALVSISALPMAVQAADHQVEIENFTFGPSTMTVAVGDTVTWTNIDSAPHTVTAEDGSFDSGNLDEGQTFSFTFAAAGTYAYICDFHSDMTATVVVQAAEAAPATAQPAATGQPAATATPAAGNDAQPDTAVAIPAGDGVPLAPLLVGLGLLSLALGLVPGRARATSYARVGGWRR